MHGAAQGSVCPQCGSTKTGSLFCKKCGATLRTPVPLIAPDARDSETRKYFGTFSAETCKSLGEGVGDSTGLNTPFKPYPDVEFRRGGRLALKGFLIGDLLASLGFGAGKTELASYLLAAAGCLIGAAYIILTLSSWKRDKQAVHGKVIAWSVAILLLLQALFGPAAM